MNGKASDDKSNKSGGKGNTAPDRRARAPQDGIDVPIGPPSGGGFAGGGANFGGGFADAAETGDVRPETASSADRGAAERLAETEKELARSNERAMRTLAELENTRRRLEREKDDAAKFGAARLAGDILVVADNLDRALKAAEETGPLKTGVDMILAELLQILERHGVTQIETAAGEPFDYDFHQAMGEIQTDEFPAGSVARVLQNGYNIHARLLRPSMVMVAKPKAGADKKDDAGEGDGSHRVDKTV